MKIKVSYSVRNIFLGFIGLVIITVFIYYSAIFAKYSFLVWVILITFLLLMFAYLRKRTGKFISGTIGEKDIDRELKDLDKRYTYIAGGLETRRGNVDKIVIGPMGVWALEVKSHNGDITFDGQTLLRNHERFEKNFLSQAYAEAKFLQELIKSKLNLDIPVQPAVVFSSNHAIVRLGLNKYKGVYVIQKGWLTKLLTETHNRSLDTDTIKKLEDFLNRA